MTRTRIFGVVALAVLVIAGLATSGFGLFGAHQPKELALSGNVDIRQVDLGFRVAGRIAEIPFDEGARVSAGAVLARLHTAPYEAAAAASRAQIGVNAAELAKQRNGNRAQDIAQAAALLDQEQATLSRTTADFERYATLMRSDTISRSSYDLSREAYQTAQGKVAAATEALSLQRAGSRQEDIDTAAAQLSLAKAQSDKTDTDLADTALRAPNDGVILTRAREPGSIVQAGDTVLTLTIDRPMRVRAYVDESNLGRISPGMAVEVTTDSNSKTYHGSIGYISPTSEFTPKTVQTQDLRTDLVYRLRVIVDDPDDGLRQGQPVTVRIPSARAGPRPMT
jgi:HlyD family secretion protein